jgi:2-oxo-4-hydroxy-4-carboxy-5-ureidoimidazoline decarboxylase
MTLDDLNSRDCQTFVEAVGWVFENSPWVAERAWLRRPFDTAETLYDAMVAEVASATPEERLALVRAHPDLGTVRLYGVARSTVDMSDASKREQAGAGLDVMTRPELERLTALNAAYRDKFGFPFLFAVRGATRHDILNTLERRLLTARDAEFDEALRQVYRIARFRLEDLLS